MDQIIIFTLYRDIFDNNLVYPHKRNFGFEAFIFVTYISLQI